jgi:hypothetical protein
MHDIYIAIQAIIDFVTNPQFVTYLMFALIWPPIVALIYAQLERLFPNILCPGRKQN